MTTNGSGLVFWVFCIIGKRGITFGDNRTCPRGDFDHRIVPIPCIIVNILLCYCNSFVNADSARALIWSRHCQRVQAAARCVCNYCYVLYC